MLDGFVGRPDSRYLPALSSMLCKPVAMLSSPLWLLSPKARATPKRQRRGPIQLRSLYTIFPA